MSNLLQEALWLLRECEPIEGYMGAFSGGKDSIALYRVATMAGVKVSWQYNNTTIDPPELLRFIRKKYPAVRWRKPRHGNFFRRMKQKGVVPNRKIRWCCDEYKEDRGPKGCVWITGVRREESTARAQLPAAGIHKRVARLHVRPLVRWDSEYLWEFIRAERLEYPALYDEGFHRLGCIGCPLANAASRKREFSRWPRYEAKWRDAIKHCWEKRAGTKQGNGKEWIGSAYLDSWESFYDAWLNDKPLLSGNTRDARR